MQRLDHRELLDGLEHLAALAQAGCIDQRVGLAAALELHVDGVPRGARHVERNHTLFADQGVDQRGLAHVRPAHDGDLDAALGALIFLGEFRALFHRQFQRLVDQLAHAVAVGRRNGIGVAHAKLVELRHHGGVLHALGLVHGQHDAAPGLAQVIGDHPVLGRQPEAAVDEEDHHVGLDHRLAGLLGHLGNDAFLGHRLEAAGIDGDERTFTDAAFAIVAITREPGQIGDKRVARTGHAVE